METENTKPHSADFPKWLFKEGNPALEGVICGADYIEKDWNDKGYFAVKNDDKPHADLMPSQVAKEAPPRPEVKHTKTAKRS